MNRHSSPAVAEAAGLQGESMYCSNCGSSAVGKFCSHCGVPLGRDAAGPEGASPWQDEVRYSTLLRAPEVRERIAAAAHAAPEKASVEDYMKVFDSFVVPLTGVSTKSIASIALPMYTRLGVKTGKRRIESFPNPPGEALVAALCSLARRGQPLENVDQAEDGCVLQASLPADVWSFAGTLIVTVQRKDARTTIEASTVIKGQIFDWGKSNRCLETLYADIRSTMSTWEAGPTPAG